MMQALVTNIQGYSIHDGPGIRTVESWKATVGEDIQFM